MVEAALNFLKSLGLDGPTFMVVIGVYVVSPFIAHTQIQTAKQSRRDRGKPKLGRWTLRFMAGAITYAIAMLVAWRIGGWGFERASNHALLSAIGYAVSMKFYLDWLERKQPDLAREFGADDSLTELGGDQTVVAPPEDKKP